MQNGGGNTPLDPMGGTHNSPFNAFMLTSTHNNESPYRRRNRLYGMTLRNGCIAGLGLRPILLDSSPTQNSLIYSNLYNHYPCFGKEESPLRVPEPQQRWLKELR